MRIRNAVILIVVSLVSAATISVTGQEEALPIVRAKDAVPDATIASAESYVSLRPEPTLYLAVEPIREPPAVTLAQAARNNDWVTFHDLYVKAQNRGEDVSRFQSLYELWSWSLSDPIGAFYGRDIYERIARAYPGFAEYIGEFVLIDRRGNTFYPTAETRAFLLERAVRGDAPRVLIASAAEASRASTPAPVRSATPRVQRATPPALKAPATAPVVDTPVVEAPPVVITPQPVVAEQARLATPEPAAAPAPVVPTPAPVVPAPQTTSEPVRQTEANDLRNRGILLLIIGLLGVGILAVILRAPKEEPRPIIDLGDKVHPIRKSGADEHRATGSHG